MNPKLKKKKSQIVNEPEILKQDKIFDDTEITNKPKNFKEQQFLNKPKLRTPNFKRSPDFKGNANYK
jgi:hypothetical protein